MGRPALKLTGQVFGKLTVIKRVETESNKHSYWLCKCECGSESIVAGSNLKNGNTSSCGCMEKESRRNTYRDIKGQRFGRLIAVKKTSKIARKSGAYWMCKCDCGNECEVASQHLLGGSVSSCGCLKTDELLKDVVEDTRLRSLVSKKRKRILKDSGVKGVVWDPERSMWKAQITFKGKRYYLGRYHSVEEATKARKRAEERFHEPILEKYDYKKER